MELLAPMHDYCLYRPAGWWVYEFCHGRFVKQFHDDPEKKTPRVQYTLGNAATGATPTFESDGVDASGSPYFSEWYTDGTVCDLTGQPRRTEVRYVCDLLKLEQFTDIKETSTCQYQVLISTPRLCAHPGYKPREGAASPIKCQLVLEDAAWDAYVQHPSTVVHTPPVRLCGKAEQGRCSRRGGAVEIDSDCRVWNANVRTRPPSLPRRTGDGEQPWDSEC